MRFLRPPPLTAWATRAEPSARGGSRTRTETLFERAASAIWATRADSKNTGGEIRTHMSRLLRTVCLPFAPLPRERILGEGIEPSTGLCPRRSHRRAFSLLRHPNSSNVGSGGRTRTLVSRSKDGRPPSGRPRHDSNVRPQAPQACALILLSYGFKGSDECGVVNDELNTSRVSFIIHHS
jgi:hypothetical protein